MTRVLWLLLVDTGLGPADLDGAVAEAAATIAEDEGLRVRSGVRSGGAEFDRLEHYRAVSGRVDAALEVQPRDSDADLFAVAKRVSTVLGSIADAATVHALIGEEHEMTPGETAWVLLYPIRRLPRISRKEFAEIWLSHGAAVREGGLSVKSSGASAGYRQFHVDPGTSEAYDGIAIAHWPDRPTLVERLTERRASVEDEKSFIDHGRSAVAAIELTAADKEA